MELDEQKTLKTDVLVRGEGTTSINIKEDTFSQQPDQIIVKWRELLNVLAEVGEIPAALIMRVIEGKIEVHAASSNTSNVYNEGATEELGCGLYCETVVGKLKELTVTDASNDTVWKDNPDIPLGMIAYYGVPLVWPDKSIFGTLCILDTKENRFPDKVKRLTKAFQTAIEADLEHYVQEITFMRRQQEAYAELEESIKANESATLAKEELLSMISHELRTPLNPIIGYSEILAENETDPDTLRALNTIHKSGTHLLSLISEILDFSKLEHGESTVEKTTFDLAEFIEGILQIMEPTSNASGIELNYKSSKGLPRNIFTDELRLRQLMINLINNALKFTDNGSVSLEINQDEEHMYFAVTDTGTGIDAENLKRIFEPFYQIDTPQKKRLQGTGLGLAICQKISQLLGAELSVESTVGKGSKFTVSYPLHSIVPTKNMKVSH